MFRLSAFIVTAFMLSPVWAGQKPYQGEEASFVDPDQLEWQPVASLEEGAEMAIIEGDPGKEEPFTMRLKLPDGLELAPHTHPEDERVTVISGTFHLAHGEEFSREDTTELKAGELAMMPAGEPMYGYAEGETIIQLHGVGPWGIEYLNPEDDPREDEE